MAQNCLKCLKYTMCAVNFLCFMCGTAVLAFGVYLLMQLNTTALLPTLAHLSVPNLLIICGIIITCVSFLGFLGALKENRCLLLTFFLLLFILMVVELIAACLLLIYEAEIGTMVQKDLEDGLAKTKADAKKNSTAAFSDWDVVQKTFNCCGVHNVTDWGDEVPPSCCIISEKCGQPPSYEEVKKKGCLDTMKNWFEENFLYTGVSVIVLCIIEVLGMCFAMTLFCHISRSGLGYKL